VRRRGGTTGELDARSAGRDRGAIGIGCDPTRDANAGRHAEPDRGRVDGV